MTSDEQKSVKEKKPALLYFKLWQLYVFFVDTHSQQLSLYHNHTDGSRNIHDNIQCKVIVFAY